MVDPSNNSDYNVTNFSLTFDICISSEHIVHSRSKVQFKYLFHAFLQFSLRHWKNNFSNIIIYTII